MSLSIEASVSAEAAFVKFGEINIVRIEINPRAGNSTVATPPERQEPKGTAPLVISQPPVPGDLWIGGALHQPVRVSEHGFQVSLPHAPGRLLIKLGAADEQGAHSTEVEQGFLLQQAESSGHNRVFRKGNACIK